jgi:presqualene diphosphate synthase
MSTIQASSADRAPEIHAMQQKAARSSFYPAMRLMPKPEREAMFAVYAFCRAVDDIADDFSGERAERLEALAAWRNDIEALYAGQRPGRTAFLAEFAAYYGLRKEDFLAVIDGMQMDVTDTICAPSLATLDLYCERVASAVGRLSIKVFGMEEGPGFALAHHLGRALQLTNILRDLDEDAAIGRLYLPREYLDEAGVESGDALKAVSDPDIDAVCRKLARSAHEHYLAADRVMRARPQGRIRTPRLMGAVYSEMLRGMERTGWAPPRRRVHLGKTRLLRVVIAHGLFG